MGENGDKSAPKRIWEQIARAASMETANDSSLQTFYICMKYMMYCFNAIIFISGGILLGLGIWIKYGGALLYKILGFYAVHVLNVGYFCIVVGLMVTVLGFLGCLGTVKKNRFLLLMFIMTMMAIFIAKIAAAVLALAFSQIVETILREKGPISLKQHYLESVEGDSVSLGWNVIMQTLNCCGFNNYTDFSDSIYINNTGRLYPKACCRTLKSAVCDGHNLNGTVIFTKGCFMMMREMLQNHSLVVGGAAAAVTALELASIMIAMVLFIKLG